MNISRHESVSRQKDLRLFNKDLSNVHLSQSGLGLKPQSLILTEMYPKHRVEHCQVYQGKFLVCENRLGSKPDSVLKDSIECLVGIRNFVILSDSS